MARGRHLFEQIVHLDVRAIALGQHGDAVAADPRAMPAAEPNDDVGVVSQAHGLDENISGTKIKRLVPHVRRSKLNVNPRRVGKGCAGAVPTSNKWLAQDSAQTWARFALPTLRPPHTRRGCL